MVLAIDIGNSIVTVGLFSCGGKLNFRSELATDSSWTRDQCAIGLNQVFQLHGYSVEQVTGTVISSVVPPLTAAMCAAAAFLTGSQPLLMGPGVKTGLNIKSEIHTQMGTDIVAYSIGAVAKYPSPLIVVEMGTAITMSLLRGNTYDGCIIMPGVRIALEALSDRAAELPHISIAPPASILGRNTVDAMRSGVVYGNASMVDGMIQRLEEAAGPISMVVATGGTASDILPYCKRDILYDANLLLEGLYLVYQKNTKQKKA